MYVAPKLWVGTAPAELLTTAKHTSTAIQAAHLIKSGDVVIVPTTDIARETLLLLGSSPEWALRATTYPGLATDVLDFGDFEPNQSTGAGYGDWKRKERDPTDVGAGYGEHKRRLRRSQ